MIKVDEATLSIQGEFIVDLKRIKLNFIQVIIKPISFQLSQFWIRSYRLRFFSFLSYRLVAE